ncbi:MAG: FtsB family cell division protein [Verrucomicrobiales bacterium]
MARPDPDATTTIWQAISRCLMWAVSIVCVCICLALFKPQMSRRAKLDAEIAELRAQRERAKDEEQAMRKRLAWIKSDPAYLEVYVRDFLDLAREGETVFYFQPEP